MNLNVALVVYFCCQGSLRQITSSHASANGSFMQIAQLIIVNDARVSRLLVAAVTAMLDVLLKSRNSRWQKVKCLMVFWLLIALQQWSHCALPNQRRAAPLCHFLSCDLLVAVQLESTVEHPVCQRRDKNNGKLAVEIRSLLDYAVSA